MNRDAGVTRHHLTSRKCITQHNFISHCKVLTFFSSQNLLNQVFSHFTHQAKKKFLFFSFFTHEYRNTLSVFFRSVQCCRTSMKQLKAYLLYSSYKQPLFFTWFNKVDANIARRARHLEKNHPRNGKRKR